MKGLEKQEITLQIQEDLNEMSRLVWDYLDKKYVSMLWKKLDGYRSECAINECKEAQLLQAIMPFLPEQKKVLGLIVDVLTYNQVIERSMQDHESILSLLRDENKEKEDLKKLLYKVIMIKALMTMEQMKQSRLE